MNREEVLALETTTNRVINATSNKIEFSDGTVYAKQMPSGLYYKVKCFVL